MSEPATHVARILRDGGEGPPLVYVPGLDGSGQLLLGTEAKLRERFRVLCLHYEVTGPRPARGDRYEDLAASVADCMDEAGIDRALVLAESFGGAVAFRLALDRPERVGAVAIINSFVKYRKTIRLRVSRALLHVVPPFVYRLARTTVGPLLLMGPADDPEAARAFRESAVWDLDEGYLRRLAMIGEVDLEAELANVRQPVHLFASTHDRIVDSVRAANEMAKLLPNVQITILPEVGHVVLPLLAEPWQQRIIELNERSQPI